MHNTVTTLVYLPLFFLQQIQYSWFIKFIKLLFLILCLWTAGASKGNFPSNDFLFDYSDEFRNFD